MSLYFAIKLVDAAERETLEAIQDFFGAAGTYCIG